MLTIINSESGLKQSLWASAGNTFAATEGNTTFVDHQLVLPIISPLDEALVFEAQYGATDVLLLRVYADLSRAFGFTADKDLDAWAEGSVGDTSSLSDSFPPDHRLPACPGTVRLRPTGEQPRDMFAAKRGAV